ncbi:hypothetical protein QM424_05040 [Streptococcus mitis]|uniref:hypothetical protein n=1 Tax=Streptococcus mitis TaxID=28037 RepID=UPI0039C3D1C6
MVKLFDLCYSEYAWDSLSKWFIVQFYFTKSIATMQKSNSKAVAFFGDIRDYCPRLVDFINHY